MCGEKVVEGTEDLAPGIYLIKRGDIVKKEQKNSALIFRLFSKSVVAIKNKIFYLYFNLSNSILL